MAKQQINLGSAPNSRDGDNLRSAFAKVNANFTELYTALGLDSGGLNLGAFEFTGSTISTTDSSGITIDQATTVTSDLTVSGDILPSVANGGNLGSSANPWRSLYVSNNTIFIGGSALKIDSNGDLTLNNNRIVQENGEFLVLDNLTDVSANSPSVGDVLTWNGGSWVNAGQASASDRLSNAGDEVVLVGGANPYVTFPAITGGDQLQIQGAEVTSISGNLALTSFTDTNIIANGSGAAPGGSKNWTFSADGSLTIPGDIRSEGNINIEINLADSTLRRWQFGEDGNLTFPDGTSQSSAGISASSTDTLTNKTINIQAGQGNVFQIQGNSITSYSGSGTVLALTSMPTFSGMNVNNSSLSMDGGSGSYYWAPTFADGTGTIHKAGVYKSAADANNSLFSFGANGAGTMSVVMDGSLFVGSSLPSNNGGLNTNYGGWLVVQAGAKFGGDLNTIGNFILDTPGNYVRFGDGTTQTTAADFGYLDLDKDTIKGTAGYQYTFATDGYFTSSTSSESTNYFFVAYNTTNTNIAAGWTVVGGTANTTVSSVTYPVAGYPGVIRVNLTAAASSTSGFYPVTVTSPDRLRVEIQPNPGTSDKFAFTTSGLTFPDATVQTTAYTGLQTTLDGDVTGSVFADDSTMIIDGTDGSVYANKLRTAETKITLGSSAGETNQGVNGIAIGALAGNTNQGIQSVAIGANSGNSDQGLQSVALGNLAGALNQGQRAVAIGSLAGSNGQGEYAVALGNFAGGTNQPANSIMINASGSALNGTEAGLYIDPVRNASGTGNILQYNTSTKEITYSSNLELTGDIRSEGNINIDINLSDSTLRRWSFGEDGDLAFPNGTVQTTAFTGNAATVDITNTNGIDTNYSITFVENRDGAEILRADVDLTFNSATNLLTAGNITTGILKIDDGVHEKFQTKSNATGTVTHDCSSGHIFYHTLPNANWTVNLTNLNLAVGYATTVTLVIEQSVTGYYPNAVQIDGNAVGLAWQGNTTPTPSNSRIDVVTLSILYDGLWTVLGQLTGF